MTEANPTPSLGEAFMAELNRAPLGVKPRHLHEEQRLAELARAVRDYASAGMPVRAEWLTEMVDLRTSIEAHRPRGIEYGAFQPGRG